MTTFLDGFKNFWNPDRNEDIEQGVFKALGDGWWLAGYTNNIRDREKEILKRDAHDRYIARVKAGFVPMPELWFWHLNGSRHGKALWVDRVGHVVFAIGKFDGTPEAKEAESTYLNSKPGSYRLSHGFLYPKWAKHNGVYEDYNTFEISTLPVGKATPAALFTEFEAVKEMNMPANEAQIEEIRKLSPDHHGNFIKRINGISEQVDKAVAELGLETKSYEDYADLTPEQKEANKSVDTQLFDVTEGIFEESIGELLKAFAENKKAVSGVVATLKARDEKREKEHDSALKELRAEIAAVKGIKQALEAEKALRPQRVEEAEKSVDENSDEGQAAAEAIKDQRTGNGDQTLDFFNPMGG